jgi:hypothetical protein
MTVGGSCNGHVLPWALVHLNLQACIAGLRSRAACRNLALPSVV